MKVQQVRKAKWNVLRMQEEMMRRWILLDFQPSLMLWDVMDLDRAGTRRSAPNRLLHPPNTLPIHMSSHSRLQRSKYANIRRLSQVGRESREDQYVDADWGV